MDESSEYAATHSACASKSWGLILALVVGVVLGAGGYWWYQQVRPVSNPVATATSASTTPSVRALSLTDDALSYADVSGFYVSKSLVSLDSIDTLSDTERKQLTSNGDFVLEYDFTYTSLEKQMQAPITWAVDIVPNRFGYTTTDQFVKNTTADGVSSSQRFAASSKYLLFTRGCTGGAVANGYDNSKSNGCELAKTAFESSLKLK